MSVALCVPAAFLLLYAALHDLAARTVPNWLPAAVLGLGLGLRLVDHSLLAGMAVTAGAFVLLVGIWLLGAMGGGDVKLWAATVSLIPPVPAQELGFVLRVVVGGGLLALLYLALSLVLCRRRGLVAGGAAMLPGRRPAGGLARVLRAERWRIGRRAPLPYACAIAGGAMLTLLPYFQVR